MVIVSPRSAALAERLGQRTDDGLGFVFVAIGMGVMAGRRRRHAVPRCSLVGMVLLVGGMAITAAPATGDIMSAVPLTKAGVGSAVNDTTRELGGALGIAVFGSIVNSAYRSNIDLGGLGLPAAALGPGRASRSAPPSASPTRWAAATGRRSSSGRRARSPRPSTSPRCVSVVIAVVSAVVVASVFTRAKEQTAPRRSPAADVVPVGAGTAE